MFFSHKKWYKLAGSPAEIVWQQNGMCIVEVAGKKITLAKYKDLIYAVAHKCPHASGIMADGSIDAIGNIICPLHRYKFNLINGRNSSGEGYFLKNYKTELREDGLFIEIEEKKLF